MASIVRGEAADALGKSQDPRVVDLLGELLEDSDVDVQGQAAMALAQVRRRQGQGLPHAPVRPPGPADAPGDRPGAQAGQGARRHDGGRRRRGQGHLGAQPAVPRRGLAARARGRRRGAGQERPPRGLHPPHAPGARQPGRPRRRGGARAWATWETSAPRTPSCPCWTRASRSCASPPSPRWCGCRSRGHRAPEAWRLEKSAVSPLAIDALLICRASRPPTPRCAPSRSTPRPPRPSPWPGRCASEEAVPSSPSPSACPGRPRRQWLQAVAGLGPWPRSCCPR